MHFTYTSPFSVGNKENLFPNNFRIGFLNSDRATQFYKRLLADGTIVESIERPDTVNHTTYLPIATGLFCERIFGPVHTYTCACNNENINIHLNVNTPPPLCEDCRVEWVDSSKRRRILSAIELASPVVHTFFSQRKGGNDLGILIQMHRDSIRRIKIGHGFFPFPLNPENSFLKPEEIPFFSKDDRRILLKSNNFRLKRSMELLELNKQHFTEPSFLDIVSSKKFLKKVEKTFKLDYYEIFKLKSPKEKNIYYIEILKEKTKKMLNPKYLNVFPLTLKKKKTFIEEKPYEILEEKNEDTNIFEENIHDTLDIKTSSSNIQILNPIFTELLNNRRNFLDFLNKSLILNNKHKIQLIDKNVDNFCFIKRKQIISTTFWIPNIPYLCFEPLIVDWQREPLEGFYKNKSKEQVKEADFYFLINTKKILERKTTQNSINLNFPLLGISFNDKTSIFNLDTYKEPEPSIIIETRNLNKDITLARKLKSVPLGHDPKGRGPEGQALRRGPISDPLWDETLWVSSQRDASFIENNFLRKNFYNRKKSSLNNFPKKKVINPVIMDCEYFQQSQNLISDKFSDLLKPKEDLMKTNMKRFFLSDLSTYKMTMYDLDEEYWFYDDNTFSWENELIYKIGYPDMYSRLDKNGYPLASYKPLFKILIEESNPVIMRSPIKKPKPRTLVKKLSDILGESRTPDVPKASGIYEEKFEDRITLWVVKPWESDNNFVQEPFFITLKLDPLMTRKEEFLLKETAKENFFAKKNYLKKASKETVDFLKNNNFSKKIKDKIKKKAKKNEVLVMSLLFYSLIPNLQKTRKNQFYNTKKHSKKFEKNIDSSFIKTKKDLYLKNFEEKLNINSCKFNSDHCYPYLPGFAILDDDRKLVLKMLDKKLYVEPTDTCISYYMDKTINKIETVKCKIDNEILSFTEFFTLSKKEQKQLSIFFIDKETEKANYSSFIIYDYDKEVLNHPYRREYYYFPYGFDVLKNENDFSPTEWLDYIPKKKIKDQSVPIVPLKSNEKFKLNDKWKFLEFSFFMKEKADKQSIIENLVKIYNLNFINKTENLLKKQFFKILDLEKPLLWRIVNFNKLNNFNLKTGTLTSNIEHLNIFKEKNFTLSPLKYEKAYKLISFEKEQLKIKCFYNKKTIKNQNIIETKCTYNYKYIYDPVLKKSKLKKISNYPILNCKMLFSFLLKKFYYKNVNKRKTISEKKNKILGISSYNSFFILKKNYPYDSKGHHTLEKTKQLKINKHFYGKTNFISKKESTNQITNNYSIFPNNINFSIPLSKVESLIPLKWNYSSEKRNKFWIKEIKNKNNNLKKQNIFFRKNLKVIYDFKCKNRKSIYLEKNKLSLSLFYETEIKENSLVFDEYFQNAAKREIIKNKDNFFLVIENSIYAKRIFPKMSYSLETLFITKPVKVLKEFFGLSSIEKYSIENQKLEFFYFYVENPYVYRVRETFQELFHSYQKSTEKLKHIKKLLLQTGGGAFQEYLKKLDFPLMVKILKSRYKRMASYSRQLTRIYQSISLINRTRDFLTPKMEKQYDKLYDPTLSWLENLDKHLGTLVFRKYVYLLRLQEIYREKFPKLFRKNMLNLARVKFRHRRRYKLVFQIMKTMKNPSSGLTLSFIPVLPPGFRPIIEIPKVGHISSDLNTRYRNLVFASNNLQDINYADFRGAGAGQQAVQKAVDDLLFIGGTNHNTTTVFPKNYKSLAMKLKGKHGRFRGNLLGKRVDYSGRSVIVVGPSLDISECGLPFEIAIKLFTPFLIRRLLEKRLCQNIYKAKQMLIKGQFKTLIWELCREVMSEHLVLLNRAPTLHRLGIQAFTPILVSGRAILLHPLVCTSFNADFDGDQMGVHIPLLYEARVEAVKLLWSINNFLSPASGEPIMLPSQDMVLGCYYLTAQSPIYYSKTHILKLQYNFLQNNRFLPSFLFFTKPSLGAFLLLFYLFLNWLFSKNINFKLKPFTKTSSLPLFKIKDDNLSLQPPSINKIQTNYHQTSKSFTQEPLFSIFNSFESSFFYKKPHFKFYFQKSLYSSFKVNRFSRLFFINNSSQGSLKDYQEHLNFLSPKISFWFFTKKSKVFPLFKFKNLNFSPNNKNTTQLGNNLTIKKQEHCNSNISKKPKFQIYSLQFLEPLKNSLPIQTIIWLSWPKEYPFFKPLSVKTQCETSLENEQNGDCFTKILSPKLEDDNKFLPTLELRITPYGEITLLQPHVSKKTFFSNSLIVAGRPVSKKLLKINCLRTTIGRLVFNELLQKLEF